MTSGIALPTRGLVAASLIVAFAAGGSALLRAQQPAQPPATPLKHVLSLQFTFGYGSGMRQTDDIPIFERFYAGGRDRPRGFDFRGMGPHDRGDPVGGDALVLGTIEYSYPIFVEFLRGAFFYDIANLVPDLYDLQDTKWRNVVGFGIRFFIPQLGNIPVKLDFGFPGGSLYHYDVFQQNALDERVRFDGRATKMKYRLVDPGTKLPEGAIIGPVRDLGPAWLYRLK